MAESGSTCERFDVVVLGGGPAGSAAATFLQRAGHSCLVLERTTFPRYHVGESLIPHTYGTIERLGLLPKMKASHFPDKHSVRFVSASGLESTPFYFSEVIEGEGAKTWQVERSEFDELCVENARDAGVDVRMGHGVERVLFEGDRATGVSVVGEDGASYTVASRVVIDASGRSTIIGSQLGLKSPVDGLNKASAWAYYSGGSRGQGIDAGETTVFMLPGHNWFWYIPLPNDIVSVGIVAAPDFVFSKSDQFEAAFLDHVQVCQPLADRLVGATRKSAVRGLRRLAYVNRRTIGDGWVMVGDAAAFLDPIYSSGIFLALASAELAAGCVHDALESNDTSAKRLGAYGVDLAEGIGVIHHLIHAFYDPDFSFGSFVERFPDQRTALVDCLVGNVVGRDMSSFVTALTQMCPGPDPLPA